MSMIILEWWEVYGSVTTPSPQKFYNEGLANVFFEKLTNDDWVSYAFIVHSKIVSSYEKKTTTNQIIY